MDGSIYVNREGGTLVKIGPVDDYYARQVVITGPAAGSTYSIPIAEYDSVFVERFRPAGPDDLVALDDASARPPRNATPEWLEEGSAGQRTLASAIARIEARLAEVRGRPPHADDQGGSGRGDGARAAANTAYADGLEDALAELRGQG